MLNSSIDTATIEWVIKLLSRPKNSQLIDVKQ